MTSPKVARRLISVACQNVKKTSRPGRRKYVHITKAGGLRLTDGFDGEEFQQRLMWRKLDRNGDIQLNETVHRDRYRYRNDYGDLSRNVSFLISICGSRR